ncbi:MAG: glycerophosphodiester phosphodiesterase family protein [Bacteroidales bacterium]|nr:glycerophosphodiester phosphodiesterase family protein [Bacteroidales bacterium]
MKLRQILSAAIISLTMMSATAFSQTKVIAHRGFWKCDGSAQNSIASLRKAAEAKVYGSEFDVQLTSDGVAIVNHDGSINGLVICKTPFSQLKDISLSNGEKISTLEEYLIEGKKHKKLKLILEIKSHPTKEMETQVTKEVVDLVKKHKMKKQVEYISFSPYICQELHRITPKSKIASLASEYDPDMVKNELKVSGVDYQYGLLKKNPNWLSQCRKNKLSVNVWTVNNPKDIEEYIKMGVDFITTDEPLKALELSK